MIYPSIKSLLEKVDNKYSLVAMTAKRARQLIDGQKPLVDINCENPVTIATNEISAGLIRPQTDEED
ncbi:DNA-directed RNA polymerase subunit omega [Garciella nitratireducens]|uniref:DNA-directed RNA polymerase subunit omega n=1 Tax=Garciella nitratireducens DSM 15102 TaxID=1121911 RepID=A0A1T4JZS8_9FIRM|nr:DNA-directed RNA polymerase subunit omega [Garciella nitratireducens]RBP39180.1 DNA-directed RNA polymerase subunit omega [Garciella nitratireducens]SJZ35535.1 DNA-directed RNA polymerase subunit omega [Garciella nitratireducens DSM 15102]